VAELIKLTDGLLHRNSFDVSGFEFDTADWDGTVTSGGPTASFALDGNGRLRVTVSGGGCMIRCLPVGVRAGDVFVYMVSGNMSTGGTHGVSCRIGSIITTEFDRISDQWPRGFTGTPTLLEVEGGVNLQTITSASAAIDRIGYVAFNAGIRDGDVGYGRVYRFESDYKELPSPVTIDAGHVGFLLSSNTQLHVQHFLVFTERYITISDVPAGHYIEFRNSANSTIGMIWANPDGGDRFKFAPDVNGVVAIDGAQFADLDRFGTYKMHLRTDAGVLVDELLSAGAWPGSTFIYGEPNAPPTAPEITSPADGSTHLPGNIDVEWNAATDPDSDPLQYEGEFWDGSAWQSLFALQSGLSFVWDPSGLPTRSDYQVRVRAHDGTQYGDYDTTAAFTIFAEPPAPSDPVFISPTIGTYERFITIALEAITNPTGEPVEVQFYIEQNGILSVIIPWTAEQAQWIWDAEDFSDEDLFLVRIGARARDTFAGGESETVLSEFISIFADKDIAEYDYEYQTEFQTLNPVLLGSSINRRPDAVSLSYLTAFSPGPLAVSDTSQGLLARAWRLRYVPSTGVFWLARASADGTSWMAEVAVTTLDNVNEIDFAFTQNGDLVIAAEREGNLWIYWFDPLVGTAAFVDYGEGRTPKTVLDDPIDVEDSDVQVFYITDTANTVRMRTQRDRYDNPTDVPITPTAGKFLEDVIRDSTRRVHIIYSLRDEVTGRYRLFRLTSEMFPIRKVPEPFELSGDFLSGELVTVALVSTLENELLHVAGGFLSGELIDMIILQEHEELFELSGEWVSGELVLVVLDNGELAIEETELSGEWVSGELVRVFFVNELILEAELTGSFVSGELETA
jgi:hypothetical protein